MEVKDPKVIAAREKKKAQAARAATKNKENKRENDEGGSSKLKRRKVLAKPKGAPHLSTGAPASRPRQILTGRIIEEGESSRGTSVYVPQWSIPLRCRVDTLEWCLELMRGHGSDGYVGEYVTARVDLEYNSKLYIDAINRYRVVKEEHSGRLLKSHEYKKSLSDPFNMAIQARWGKGLSKGHTDKEIMVVLHKAEDFDPYSDKKLYPTYDKLFEKEYPYVEKIASGYRHLVANLLKVHPDPAPFESTSTPTISKALSRFGVPPPKKT
ncbi:hypothetical protein Tco_1212192 [Tanacetum coccineum]